METGLTVAAFDAATSGRFTMVYYQKMLVREFLNALMTGMKHVPGILEADRIVLYYRHQFLCLQDAHLEQKEKKTGKAILMLTGNYLKKPFRILQRIY